MSISEAAPAAKKRRKRSPEEAREEALTAARELLIESGPTAVTLAAIGKRVGMTHANVIHHFGSAAGLQSALMGSMVRDLTVALGDAVAHVRSDSAAPRALIDIVFDAFDKGGAGRLAAWIALSGDLGHLEPVRQAVTDLVEAIAEKFADEGPSGRRRIQSAVLLIALMAFGDSMIGGPLRGMLGAEDDAGRSITAQVLPSFF
ncbi:TetR/AcrR family transcriptional regulator [Caulobacter mirabilis]|uniref:TetR family transcriptional regulator n=1 Tax=Caulobacter mirabilis TaxID=69666 RepID=A0A2D2B1N6_9CAUL|nr:TetR/AcrR family transcriptional regulator [Caulobacter mirabilis]ATQ44175.1 TetR family transcriptional regulator [Caulobacter mirabilis]